MPTSILSTASTAATSSDVTLTTDTLVALKSAAAGAQVNITLKDDAGSYHLVDDLTKEKPSGILPAGTYQFTRVAGASCGVFSA